MAALLSHMAARGSTSSQRYRDVHVPGGGIEDAFGALPRSSQTLVSQDPPDVEMSVGREEYEEFGSRNGEFQTPHGVRVPAFPSVLIAPSLSKSRATWRSK